MKLSKFLLIILIFPLTILLSSWGGVGHQIISSSIVSSFTIEMSQFEDWLPFLTEHASDADYRKGSDPSEGPKHYIDIDAYPEFISTGQISISLDSCISLHGLDFVDDQGYLPWATLNSYNTLVESMKQEEWDNAKIAAADLGHYVADGFMPMHITKNYDGQISGNDGIHSRYESGMIGEYQSEIIYDGSPVENIEDITAYIFGYIYKNYKYLDDVLAADNKAKSVDASFGSLYTETMWEETGDFTIELFQGASHAFANLIYNAWREAGRPGLSNTSLFISEDTTYLHEYIGVTYGDVGVLYVVPADTQKDLALIRSASLDSLNAIASFEVKVPISDLANGTYWIYARNYSGKLSGPIVFSVSATSVHSFQAERLEVYPNPFVHTSFIDFKLSQNDHVSVKVMDGKGRLVEVLHSGRMTSGSHQLAWQNKNELPGVYFVVFEIGDGAIIKRIIKK